MSKRRICPAVLHYRAVSARGFSEFPAAAVSTCAFGRFLPLFCPRPWLIRHIKTYLLASSFQRKRKRLWLRRRLPLTHLRGGLLLGTFTSPATPVPATSGRAMPARPASPAVRAALSNKGFASLGSLAFAVSDMSDADEVRLFLRSTLSLPDTDDASLVSADSACVRRLLFEASSAWHCRPASDLGRVCLLN